MAGTFLLGRAGAGKTRACLDELLAALAQPDERRLVLLVPEQAAFQMERALALRAPGGGFTRAEVLSFSRLAQRVFDATGGQPPLLRPQARALALRAVVARGRARLSALRRAAETAGFCDELGRLIEELLAEGITPGDFATAADRLNDTAAQREAHEQAELYAAYVEWLGPARIDPAAQLAVLRERLTHVAWLRDASFWVDGFAGFTGQELDTLVTLARLARDMTITLLLDPAGSAVSDPRQMVDPLGLFQRTETTYQRLHALLADAGVEIKPPRVLHPTPLPRFAGAPGLATLEAALSAPPDTPLLFREGAGGGSAGQAADPHPAIPLEGGGAVQSHVRIVRCATHRDELRAAARWIRTRLADARGSLRFRDFALIARDLTPFAELVAEVFEEYEIPYFLDRRRSLRAHPLRRLLAALGEVVQSDFDVPATTKLLRTGLLPLERDDLEQLENLVVSEQVRGRAWWERPHWEFADRGSDNFAAQRRTILAALEPLLHAARMDDGKSQDGSAGPDGPALACGVRMGAAWAVALADVLERLRVREQLGRWMSEDRGQRRWEAAETHRLAWEAVCGVLEDLHAVLGDTPLTLVDLSDVLRSALAEQTLGLAPPAVDQVLVGAIERSRHPDIKHAWVFAFNEGVFPAPPPADLLLSTPQREALSEAGLRGLPIHRQDVLGERLLAYIACTRPSESLTLSFATVGDDGGERLPSPLLADMQARLPDLAVERDDPDQPPAHVTELARGWLRVRAAETAEGQRYQRLIADVQEMPARAGTLAWLLRGRRYAAQTTPLPPSAGGDAHATVWETSPSEIETYLQCPFRHYVRYRLRLSELRGPTPLRWDLGKAAHAILAGVTQRAIQEAGGVRAISDDRWRSLLEAAVRDLVAGWPADEAERRPDRAFHTRHLAALLEDLVAAHAARWRRGRFEPLACELSFGGDDAALPALELHLSDGGRVRVRGQIDRIDVADTAGAARLLVYDYKSRVDWAARPWLTGSRLQLFLYLLALGDARAAQTIRLCKSENRDDVQLAGGLLAPLYPGLKALEPQYAAQAAADEQLMYLYRPRGLVSDDAAVLLDTQLGNQPSPVANLRLKKNGGFYEKCDARPAAALAGRLDLAAETVRFAAAGVCAGRIEIAPLVEGNRRACLDCDFSAVCRFDPAYHPGRAVETTLPRLAEADVTGDDA
jgi:ATP-dependent helicase/nuclease subunit B